MKKAAELDESDEYGSDGDSEEFFSKRPGAAAVPGTSGKAVCVREPRATAPQQPHR